MKSLFPESCANLSFVSDFYQDVIKRLAPDQTLAQIFAEAYHVDEGYLDPTKIQAEYKEFMERTRAVHCVLRALNVCSAVTRFSSDHPFAVGLGKVAREFAQKEEESVNSGQGPIRLCSEPPYLGGDPEMRRYEVDPGVAEYKFDLWRDLRAMYTRCEIADDQREANDYYLFQRLQMRWDEMVQVRRIAQVIHNTPGHECVPKIVISRRYRVTTNLLLHHLRGLRISGPESVIPAGAVWGTAPEGEERYWKQYSCEFCGREYYAPLDPCDKE